MRKTKIAIFFSFVFVIIMFLSFSAQAGISTTDLNSPSLTPQDLVNSLLGGGISVSNVVYTGDNSAGGNFTGGTGIIGFESGIIISSGKIADVVGPNNLDDTTTSFGTPGDTDLDTLIPGYTTFDATVLEFDFVPIGDKVTFKFVFASEEYNEYTNSQFNNVFGFFVNGSNQALLPDGVTPVAINNVNGGLPSECGDGIDNDGDGLIDGADPDCTTSCDNIVGELNSNSQYFINNDCSDLDGCLQPCPIDIEADGLSVVMTFIAQVNANVMNHMKIGIADAGDSILDTWVFIEEGSFKVPEICDDGIDNDLDGLIDNDDPDCWICGDGDLDQGEECDDGNNEDGDGCSSSCELEENLPPDCGEAYAGIEELWPPNHKYADIPIMGVTDPDGDPVTIVITGITQDEPVNAKGDGNTSPDGTGVGTGTACVRAEREGTGNGRVYEISFTATNPAGAECSGSVTVCVPHDQKPGHECIDDGQDYDSTVE